MLRYLDQPIGKLVAEEDISQLLQELTDASGVGHRDEAVLHFLPSWFFACTLWEQVRRAFRSVRFKRVRDT